MVAGPVLLAPERIETERLVLRRPNAADAPAIFDRYASDVEVTRFLSWPRHTSIDETHVFIGFSDSEWRRAGAGPYVACFRSDGALCGGTGLSLDAPDVAQTGYVFARDAWGQGLATESLRAMVELSTALRLRRLYAYCHVDHHASAHVLEKGGFAREAVLARHMGFPNLSKDPADVYLYARSP
jgi:[ribosomal protein S5]-alanine N-acetyltransferase